MATSLPWPLSVIFRPELLKSRHITPHCKPHPSWEPQMPGRELLSHIWMSPCGVLLTRESTLLGHIRIWARARTVWESQPTLGKLSKVPLAILKARGCRTRGLEDGQRSRDCLVTRGRDTREQPVQDSVSPHMFHILQGGRQTRNWSRLQYSFYGSGEVKTSRCLGFSCR